MIRFLDYLFINLYQFVFFLRKDHGYAKFGAILYMGAIIGFGIIATANSFIWIVYDELIDWSPVVWMLIYISGVIFPVIRYFFFADISDIKQSFSSINKTQQKVFRIFMFVLLILIIFGTFFPTFN